MRVFRPFRLPSIFQSLRHHAASCQVRGIVQEEHALSVVGHALSDACRNGREFGQSLLDIRLGRWFLTWG